MPTPLRLLLLEDSPSDAELVRHELRHAGYDPVGDRVETEDDYRDHLQQPPEIILSDFAMPQFDSLQALDIAKELRLDIPFIIVSGTIGEERAVEAMRRGATDYVIKDRLGRLGQVVARALEQTRMRNETRLAERRLAAQHAVTEALAESPTLATASGKILRAICQSLAWDFGALWQVDDCDKVLRCVDCWRGPAADVADFETITAQSSVASGVDFPGRIWASAQAAWVADVAEDFDSPRAQLAARASLHGALGFPITLGAETLGCFEFLSHQIRKPDEETLKMMMAIGSQLGQYIERKRAEASLRQSNQTLQALIQAAPMAIITLNQHAHVTMWNAAAGQIFGWSETEVLGEPLPLVPENQRKSFEAEMKKELQGTSEPGRELQLLHKNGALLDVNLWTAPVTDAKGLIVGTMDLFVDVTGRKSLEEQFRQSQKMEAVGQLAAGVAHDFNNLLTIILGYAELRLGKMAGTDPNREALVEIRKAADRAALLTRQLLAFGRKQILAPVVLDLNARITEFEKMLRRLIGADVELVTILDPQLGRLRIDPGQVEQVITNLVVNARDAMPTGGRIVIRTLNAVLTELQAQRNVGFPSGACTLFAVSDTGCGMDELTKARIFEPFFTTKDIGKGTGLGLATVFGIVKQSGGFIEVDSIPGSGSTFRIYLPQVVEAPRPKQIDRALTKSPRGTETILLVEDEDGLRELTQLILQGNGYKVLSTSSGGKALELCEAYADEIQLLFTDVVMPHMSGRQLADLLIPTRSGMKVLYMSGYTDDTIVRHGIQEAGTNFLFKPFTPIALVEKVREVIDGMNGQHDNARAGRHAPASNGAGAGPRTPSR